MTGHRPASAAVPALLGLVLVALSIRAPINVVGPVFGAVAAELGLPVVVLSFIGAAPPIGFAVAGLLVPPLTRRARLEAALLLALAALLAGQTARLFSAEPIVLVASTFVTMLGIGAANVLLPPLVRRYFPSRIAPVTSLYLVLMSVSASTASFAAVPIAEATNWRVAFAVWIAVPVLALVPWLALLRSARRAAVTVVEFDDGRAGRAVVTHRPVVASRVVWAITATLALSSISAYVAVAFLPGILVASAGLTPAAAGVALGVGVALGIPAALVVPLLAVRRRAVVPVIAVSGAFALVGWGGLLLAPTAAPFLWAALLGLVPITFPLSLVLVNTRTRDHRVTVSVSGFVQGVAYVSAGAFSFVVGVVHDATRAWTIPLLVLMATALLAVPATIVLARGRMVDDELESPR